MGASAVTYSFCALVSSSVNQGYNTFHALDVQRRLMTQLHEYTLYRCIRGYFAVLLFWKLGCHNFWVPFNSCVYWVGLKCLSPIAVQRNSNTISFQKPGPGTSASLALATSPSWGAAKAEKYKRAYSTQVQGSSASVPLAFGEQTILCCRTVLCNEGCVSSIPGLNLLDANSNSLSPKMWQLKCLQTLPNVLGGGGSWTTAHREKGCFLVTNGHRI